MIKIIKYLYMVMAFISLVSFSPDIYSQDSEKKKVTYKKNYEAVKKLIELLEII